ncbi:MAG: phospho-sugar mutase [Oligoflexia bacterium]|nr:phospho-sugar mutase [Oligoflexia bacterium]
MSQEVLEKAKAWANNEYFDMESRKEISDLLERSAHETKAKEELFDRFYKDIEFGTGGLRAIMGMGSNRMSKYTVRMATHALATVVKKHFAKSGEELRVALSYDSRRFSDFFAKEAASVLAANGIVAYIFDRLNPTPFLSFAVRYLKAHAGIMITASHNPPAYNGYKVYWNDGAQVIPPYDKEIIDEYYGISDFSTISYMNFEQGLRENKIRWMGREVEDAYHQKLKQRYFRRELCERRGDELKIVYTPIHGTGYIPCLRALSEMGMSNVRLVQEQINPDSNFSTVPSPNPEDPRALKLAVDLMKLEERDIVFGTDPDADRIGVVVRHQGEAQFLNGNQVGILLLHYLLSSMKERGELRSDSLVIKSIVTSEMQTALAKHFGVEIHSTLTGFKWMCGLWNQIEKERKNLHFVMASEESYGYLVLEDVRDKDAISATAMMAEMALWYKTRGMTLIDALDEMYKEVGLFYEGLLSLDYLGKEGEEKIKRIMEHFRSSKENTLCGEKITKIEDYELGEERDLQSGKVQKLIVPNSNVIGYTLESGSKVYLRPSGTEPKIKFYFLIRETSKGELASLKVKAKHRSEEISNFFRATSERA